jgi:hypothetical protein
MKEDSFSFATFCYVYPQNWRLSFCPDFREILPHFVSPRFVSLKLNVVGGYSPYRIPSHKKIKKIDVWKELKKTKDMISNEKSPILSLLRLMTTQNLNKKL